LYESPTVPIYIKKFKISCTVPQSVASTLTQPIHPLSQHKLIHAQCASCRSSAHLLCSTTLRQLATYTNILILIFMLERIWATCSNKTYNSIWYHQKKSISQELRRPNSHMKKSPDSFCLTLFSTTSLVNFWWQGHSIMP
jgi:hypothetical protein